jgi:hypothetical protein
MMQKKVICLLIYCCFMCFSCNGQQTEQDFKKKYDYEECIAMFLYSTYMPTIHWFEYEFNGIHYKIQSRPTYIYNESILPGFKYPILIDTNNPRKNYMVLYDQSILQDTNISYEATAKILLVYKHAEMTHVKYELYIVFPDGIKSYKRDEYLPIEYLEICKQIKKEKKDITVNIYPFIEYGTNESMNIPFIDRESLR